MQALGSLEHKLVSGYIETPKGPRSPSPAFRAKQFRGTQVMMKQIMMGKERYPKLETRTRR